MKERPTDGGEMGGRVRAFDWARTPLGRADGWPPNLTTLVDLMLGMPQPAFVCWGREARLIYNDGYRQILGGKHPGALGSALVDVWPELADVLEPMLAAIFEGQPQRLENAEFELGGRGPGLELAWFSATWTPVRGGSGAVEGFFAVAVEITERVRAEERQALLLAELQHRVRSILGMVRTLIRRTKDGAETVDELVALLDGRITALARTQALLTRGAGASVDLESLVREELLAQGAEQSRISVEGPAVQLAPQTAEVLSLAIHELAANATAHGAIGQAGDLAISWRIAPGADGADWLHFGWTERGVQVLTQAPRRHGFGTELIEQRVPHELKGQGRVDLRPGGVTAEIAFPLTRGERVFATARPLEPDH